MLNNQLSEKQTAIKGLTGRIKELEKNQLGEEDLREIRQFVRKSAQIEAQRKKQIALLQSQIAAGKKEFNAFKKSQEKIGRDEVVHKKNVAFLKKHIVDLQLTKLLSPKQPQSRNMSSQLGFFEQPDVEDQSIPEVNSFHFEKKFASAERVPKRLEPPSPEIMEGMSDKNSRLVDSTVEDTIKPQKFVLESIHLDQAVKIDLYCLSEEVAYLGEKLQGHGVYKKMMALIFSFYGFKGKAFQTLQKLSHKTRALAGVFDIAINEKNEFYNGKFCKFDFIVWLTKLSQQKIAKQYKSLELGLWSFKKFKQIALEIVGTDRSILPEFLKNKYPTIYSYVLEQMNDPEWHAQNQREKSEWLNEFQETGCLRQKNIGSIGPEFHVENLLQVELNRCEIHSFEQPVEFFKTIGQYLCVLKLSSNRIIKIPDALAIYCKDLSVLDLSYNQISVLPSNLCDLGELITLELTRYFILIFFDMLELTLNKISEIKTLPPQLQTLLFLPIFLIPQLQTLDMRYNQLKKIPNLIFTMTSLEQVNFSSNYLLSWEVDDDQDFSNSRIERCNANSNWQLIYPPQKFLESSNLKHIDLKYCSITKGQLDLIEKTLAQKFKKN